MATKRLLDLVNVKKFYADLPHQKVAVSWLGDILLNTPAKDRLNLSDSLSILKCTDEQLQWLQNQISRATLERFTKLWRLPVHTQSVDIALFSQRDNSVLPYTTCSSSAHAMYTDHQLRRKGQSGLDNDEGFLRRVFSGRYGKYGRNPSVSWDIQTNVCKSYGVNSRYQWDSDLTGLMAEVDKNGSSVINIYHKGYTRRDRGGGHVVLVAGIDNKEVIIHDPYGSRPPQYKYTEVGSDINSPVTQPKKLDEYDVLRRIVLAEARGEGELGMALVSRVILNRLNLTKRKLENFNTTDPTIRGIVYAPWQFEPTWSRTNNIKDIYSKVTNTEKVNASNAIILSQNEQELINRLISTGLSRSKAETVIRSTFFAAATHPQAIEKYIHHRPILVGRQIFGEGKRTRHVDKNVLLKSIQFKDKMGDQPFDIQRVGIYKMTMAEFTEVRWQGCWRSLLD